MRDNKFPDPLPAWVSLHHICQGSSGSAIKPWSLISLVNILLHTEPARYCLACALHRFTGLLLLLTAWGPLRQGLPAGLSRENEGESVELEASQGDRIVGIISRQEVAVLTAAALDSPASAGMLSPLSSYSE